MCGKESLPEFVYTQYTSHGATGLGQYRSHQNSMVRNGEWKPWFQHLQMT